MSPAPDAQQTSENSTDGRMRKIRFDKHYDPADESLRKAIMEVGDEQGSYRLEFSHTSHGRLTFQSISKADGSGWEEVDVNTLDRIHEALRVAGRAAQDDRLGVETPLSGTEIAADVDLYDDIDPDGYVESADSEELVTDGSG